MAMPWEGQLFIGEAGGTPTTELKDISDVKLSRSRAKVASKRRRNGAYVSNRAGAMEIGWSFKFEEGGEHQATLEDAFEVGTPISVYGKAYATGKGPLGDFVVAKFDRDESAEPVSIDVELALNTDSRLPTVSNA